MKNLEIGSYSTMKLKFFFYKWVNPKKIITCRGKKILKCYIIESLNYKSLTIVNGNRMTGKKKKLEVLL